MAVQRVVIVAGGELAKKDVERISPQDWIIAVDGGARLLMDMGVQPSHVVGDFDTLDADHYLYLQQLDIPLSTLPAEKDLTDTQYAIELASKMEIEEFILLGFCGGSRIDHAIANLNIMESLLKKKIKATLYYLHNRIRVFQGPAHIYLQKEEEFRYVSLLPISEQVQGVTLSGFKYGLQQATLRRDNTRGISNELCEVQGEIRFSKGTCFLVESNDHT